MKDQFLKIAGVKTEAAFYKKYKTEKDFFKAHPEAKKSVKKAHAGVDLSFMNSTFQGMNNIPNMSNIVQGQMQSPGVNAGMFPTNSTPDYNQMYMNMSTEEEQLTPNSGSGFGNQVAKYAPMVGDLMQGYQSLKAGRKAKKEAQKWAAVTDVQARAAESQDIDDFRQYTENAQKKKKAFMPEITGEEFFPVYGVGTNVLAKNGTEIANTFAPGTIYDDAGYEPLDDSNQVKQFDYGGKLPKAFQGMEMMGGSGGGTPWGMIGGMGSDLTGSIVGKDGGSQIGGTLGGVAGMAIGGPAGQAIGQIAGTAIGGLLDTNDRDQRKAEAKIRHNQNRMMAAQYRGNIQGQFAGYMEDGGNVPMMEQGGDLNTHWGGYAEPMSYNPYLPDSGETVMFRGQSHEESDGQGNTGIGITFGNSPVEVERGEPAVKLRDGGTGEDNLTVYGNLMIPDYGVEILGDKKAKGRKFKNYIADISKTEAKQNKLIDKSTNELDELDLKTPFDKLKLSSLQANILGGNMKLKDVADKKIKAADIQNAINETAEEYSLVADDLAKGKIKIDKKTMNMREAMFGTKLTKAQNGEEIPDDAYGLKIWEGNKTGLGKKTASDFTLKEWNQIAKNYGFKGKGNKEFQKFLMSHPETSKIIKARHNILYGKNPETDPSLYDGLLGKGYAATELLNIPKIETTPLKEEKKVESAKEENKFEIIKNKKNPWINIGYQTLKGFLDRPYEEELSPDQLMGEYYALSSNQVEPVQATPYTPQLRVPYDISYQDQLNEVTADQRAVQRMLGYNPAAQANVVAQAYGAKSKILADQFRANQAMKDQVYSGNIATLNDADLKNLAIYDQQYTRQEQAKSNTKAVAQAALSSIGDKLAKHKADVRTYNVYKTLFPQYGFDKSGKGRFEGGYADFNISQSQYPFYNNPNYALVKNSDGTFTYKLKEQLTKDDQVMANPKTPSMATNPINENNVVYEDDEYEYIASPIKEREEMLPSKRTGGNIRKNYSQSSIVKAFK